MIELEDFRDQGKCGPYYAETGKDHWFGPREDSLDAYDNITSTRERLNARRRDRDKAKALCAICPVKALCLQWAMENREPAGIWGGLDVAERTRLKNQMAARAAMESSERIAS